MFQAPEPDGEVDPQQKERAEEKIKYAPVVLIHSLPCSFNCHLNRYIMAELLATEKEYISKLETLITVSDW